MAGAYVSLEHAHYFAKGISADSGFIMILLPKPERLLV
jgi:ABC-type uncharacterized transport system permease subunit